MKKLISAVFGACALAMAVGVSAPPAEARSNVGVYIGPNGIGISVERQRRLCRDYWYRRHHRWCSRYYDDGYSYYPRYYRYNYGHYRYRDRDRHRRYHDHDRDRDHRW